MRVFEIASVRAGENVAVCRLQFAADGRSLAAVLGVPGNVPHAVAVCDTPTGATTWEVAGEEMADHPVAVSSALDRVAWVIESRVGLRDAVRYTQPGTTPVRWLGDSGPLTSVNALAFHPRERTLAMAAYLAAGDGWAVARWAEAGDSPAGPIPLPDHPTDPPHNLAWSADGDRIAVFSHFGVGHLLAGLNPAGADVSLLPTAPLPPPFWSVAFAPDGRRLLAHNGRALAVYDFDRMTWGEPLDRKPYVRAAAFSPNGEVLAVARQDGSVEFRDPRTLAVRRAYQWKLGPLTAVAFAPDGLTCAAGGRRRRVVVWDVE
jgi:WD40 repeat protein